MGKLTHKFRKLKVLRIEYKKRRELNEKEEIEILAFREEFNKR